MVREQFVSRKGMRWRKSGPELFDVSGGIPERMARHLGWQPDEAFDPDDLAAFFLIIDRPETGGIVLRPDRRIVWRDETGDLELAS